MKKRVLFVDDEPKILDGLRRMLRVMRNEWETAFVQSGPEALDALGKNRFDVIVSDMRMPGMDGAELLFEVRKRYPEILRIILSGHSDQELVLKSVRPAHQYLAKPCDAETLKIAVSRGMILRDLLNKNSLNSIISQIESLPSLPALYEEILKEMQSKDPSIRKVGEIISKDVAMTAKILQLVNSAFFGLPRRISTPMDACSLLGIETIEALVLSVQIFSKLSVGKNFEKYVERLYSHSMATGSMARALAMKGSKDKAVADEAFMSGLLHDVGKIVFISYFPESYKEVLEIVETEQVPLSEAEQNMFGTMHAEVGAYLMGIWGMNDPIIEALAFHHKPSDCPSQEFSPLVAVHAADALENAFYGGFSEKADGLMDVKYLERLHLIDRVSEWRKICEQLVQGEENDE